MENEGRLVSRHCDCAKEYTGWDDYFLGESSCLFGMKHFAPFTARQSVSELMLEQWGWTMPFKV